MTALKVSRIASTVLNCDASLSLCQHSDGSIHLRWNTLAEPWQIMTWANNIITSQCKCKCCRFHNLYPMVSVSFLYVYFIQFLEFLFVHLFHICCQCKCKCCHFLREITWWLPAWRCNVLSKIWLHQSKNDPAKFHPDPIWSDRVLRFFEEGRWWVVIWDQFLIQT